MHTKIKELLEAVFSISDQCRGVAFKIPDMYDYMTKLCRTQTELILHRVNPNVRGIGQGESRRRKYKRLKLGGGQAYESSVD
jgi:hypothetical protein